MLDILNSGTLPERGDSGPEQQFSNAPVVDVDVPVA